MKTIMYALLLLAFIGCKKEERSIEEQINGTWLFKEGRYGTGGGVNVVKADPSQPVTLVLKKDGSFSISNQPLILSLQIKLQEFDRYQLVPGNQVRFYNTATSAELIYKMELDHALELYYPGCREGCSDFFIKN